MRRLLLVVALATAAAPLAGCYHYGYHYGHYGYHGRGYYHHHRHW